MAVWNQVSNMWTSVASQIRLVTWNVHNSGPPSDLSELLALDNPPLPDIYAIGLQEVGQEDWEHHLMTALKPYDYVKVKSRRLLGIFIIVFVKRSHLPFVFSIESEVTKTGFGGYWGNKGAASIRMDYMGMNLIIVNSHLAAHTEEISERLSSINSILDSQKFKDRDTDNIMDHDYVFWMGDLNFRLENISFNRVLNLIRNEDYRTLKANDQLHLVMEEGLAFEGFHEGKLTFSPTYKFDVGTDIYDSSRQQRVPSYTDRILFHFHDTHYGKIKLHAKSLSYQSHPNYRISDHKPVSAVIEFSCMSRGSSSPVNFIIGPEQWSKLSDKDVEYTVRKDFNPSIGDWIGLYKANFMDFNSYLTYKWTSNTLLAGRSSSSAQVMSIQFSSLQLCEISDGEYVLCYMTRKSSLCGISPVFYIS